MTLNAYFEYIRNPLADAKARVVTASQGESWTALRRFCQERGDVELRLSDLVRESAWLPMPDEVFQRVSEAMTAPALSGKGVVLLGVPGYLALLSDDNKRTVIEALREWVDGASERNSVCFLLNDRGTQSLLNNVFVNPRYRQRKQLIEIDAEQVKEENTSSRSSRLVAASDGIEGSARRIEVMLVGSALAPFIPEVCDTFQKYLRYTEDHPFDNAVRRIVVASEGRKLAGLSTEVRQVVCLRDFVREFYEVDPVGLSEDALEWMCERGKEGASKTLLETLNIRFFPDGGIKKRVLNVFDRCKDIEREALLWLLKQVAPKGSYLERVVEQEEVFGGNFRAAYITGAKAWLDDAPAWAIERKEAIRDAVVEMSLAAILQFIALCASESTSRVAPWLNVETDVERAELLRRCVEDGVVSNTIKDVYPEVAKYLNADPIFDNLALEDYFSQYRELKMISRITPEFYAKAAEATPGLVQSRDAIVQQYVSDNGCALLVVDAMGAEWLPMLVAMARERNLGVDMVAVGAAQLPTSTKFNKIYWPDTARRLPDIKRLDNIAHKGVEANETKQAEENLVAGLDVIGSKVLSSVSEGLAHFERVLVTADHGSSRLAVLAWQSEPRLAQTLPCEEGVEIADWRYREQAAQNACPSELEETLDGEYWVVRGYDRLPKSGGKLFELHGGATLEERLVPAVIFSRTGQYVPKTGSSGAQITENDDFDL